MPGDSSVRSLKPSCLKAGRNEIDKYSGMAQSHASLPTTTRALISTLCTRKLHCQMQQNWPSSSIEHRLYLVHLAGPRRTKKKKISGSRREETKDVSVTSQSTYKVVSEARGSKVPGGSSVRLPSTINLRATRNETNQIFRAGPISCLIAHHH